MNSLRGIVFFGTPYAGSDFTPIAEAAASLIKLTIVEQPNSEFLRVLRKNPSMLANIENDFSKLVLRRPSGPPGPVDLFVFVEELPVHGPERVSWP